MLKNSFVVFFRLHGLFEASFHEITFGWRPLGKGKQGMQLDGRQPRPPPHQTQVNAKLLKFSPNKRRLLIDDMMLDLFTNLSFIPPIFSKKIDAEMISIAF